MSDGNDRLSPDKRLEVLGLLKTAACVGLVVMTGVAVLVVSLNGPLGGEVVAGDRVWLFRGLALAVLAVGVIGSTVVPGLMQKQPSPGGAAATYVAGQLVRIAVLEGPGVLGAVLYLLTGDTMLLLTPVTVLAVLLVGGPSAERMRRETRSSEGPE